MQEVYLWPCNTAAWACWRGVQTQWRVGTSGPTGLCYSGVRAYLSELSYTGTERQDIFHGICAAELATLQAWEEQRPTANAADAR